MKVCSVTLYSCVLKIYKKVYLIILKIIKINIILVTLVTIIQANSLPKPWFRISETKISFSKADFRKRNCFGLLLNLSKKKLFLS